MRLILANAVQSASAAHDTSPSKPSATENPADHSAKRVVFDGAKPDFSRPLKVDARSGLPEMDRPGFRGKKAKALMAPDTGLQAAIMKARLAVKPRGRGDQVSANKLQNTATELQRQVDTALATGFPASDPLVAEARTLLATLGEIRTQVRQAHALPYPCTDATCICQYARLPVMPGLARVVSTVECDATAHDATSWPLCCILILVFCCQGCRRPRRPLESERNRNRCRPGRLQRQ